MKTKKPSINPFREDEGATASCRTHSGSHPCLLARQAHGPQNPGLDEHEKAGLLTWRHSTASPYHALAQWLMRPSHSLQRRYRTGFTPVSLFSSDRSRRHFLHVSTTTCGVFFQRTTLLIGFLGRSVNGKPQKKTTFSSLEVGYTLPHFQQRYLLSPFFV